MTDRNESDRQVDEMWRIHLVRRNTVGSISPETIIYDNEAKFWDDLLHFLLEATANDPDGLWIKSPVRNLARRAAEIWIRALRLTDEEVVRLRVRTVRCDKLAGGRWVEQEIVFTAPSVSLRPKATSDG